MSSPRVKWDLLRVACYMLPRALPIPFLRGSSVEKILSLSCIIRRNLRPTCKAFGSVADVFTDYENLLTRPFPLLPIWHQGLFFVSFSKLRSSVARFIQYFGSLTSSPDAQVFLCSRKILRKSFPREASFWYHYKTVASTLENSVWVVRMALRRLI